MLINTNTEVRVRLTAAAIKVHRENYDRLWGTQPRPLVPYREPLTDIDGWSYWTLWGLMNEFGHAMRNGGPLMFDDNVIDFVKLEDVSNTATEQDPHGSGTRAVMAKERGEPFIFTVEGSDEFPFDMLRYDACWPVEESDANKMWCECTEQRRVVLKTTSPNAPTNRRWEASMWRVIGYGASRG